MSDRRYRHRADERKPGRVLRIEFDGVTLDLTRKEQELAAQKAAGYQVMVQNGLMSLEEAAAAIVQDLTSMRQAQGFALGRQ
jgi:hypothetical protein